MRQTDPRGKGNKAGPEAPFLQEDEDAKLRGEELAEAAPAGSDRADGSADMIDALVFKVVVDQPWPPPRHSKYRTEGYLNEGLERHMKECKECRDTIVGDLREFALQLEQLR
jgi:hypothetical protein